MGNPADLAWLIVGLMFVAGSLGGLLGAALALWALRMWLPGLLARQTVRVELEAGTLRLPVQVQAPGPVTVPLQAQVSPVTVQVEATPAPTMQEMARRVTEEFPEAGVRAVARIIGCSPSTESVILNGSGKKGDLPDGT